MSTLISKKVQKFYNKHWKSFDASRVRIWEALREFILMLIEGSTILECGCGNGKNINYLQKLGFKVKGFDFSQKLIDVCKSRNYDVQFGNIIDIPFEDNSFDNVICIAVLHHLDKESDRLKAIDEMVRVCKPGGKILVSVWAVTQEDNEKIKRNFHFGDNLVPYRDDQRYYYIYDQKHIDIFLSKTKLPIVKKFWEKGNWFFIIEKPK